MSVEKAKEAVQCDVKDGMSWCKWIISFNVFDLISVQDCTFLLASILF